MGLSGILYRVVFWGLALEFMLIFMFDGFEVRVFRLVGFRRLGNLVVFGMRFIIFVVRD